MTATNKAGLAAWTNWVNISTVRQVDTAWRCRSTTPVNFLSRGRCSSLRRQNGQSRRNRWPALASHSIQCVGEYRDSVRLPHERRSSPDARASPGLSNRQEFLALHHLFLPSLRLADFSGSGAGSHRESNFVLGGIRLGLNDQRKIPFAERRKRKLNFGAALIVAPRRVDAIPESTFDGGVYVNAGLGFTIGARGNFQFQRNFPGAEPRAGIQELYLDSGMARCLIRRLCGSDFIVKTAGAKRFNHCTVLIFHLAAQV